MTPHATRPPTATPSTTRRRRRPPDPAGTTESADDLTPEQQAAIDDLRDALAQIKAADQHLQATITTRQRSVQKHHDAITAIGLRRTARILGTITESTLRLDAKTRIDDD
ncbi:MAG: hypothetical protein ACRCSN_15795 [Dermatophilaceae bacterium]